MPPAFNLSQDQTLQFNLYAAILISPCEPIDLTQSEFILLFSTSCELLFLCSEFNQLRLSLLIKFLSPHTHTNRLFYLNFKELFCFRSRHRSVEEVRIIQINLTSSIYIFIFFFVGLRGQDLNLRPSGYEPDELPDCSTPRQRRANYSKVIPVRQILFGIVI